MVQICIGAAGIQFLLGLYRSGSKNDDCFGILLQPVFNFFLDFTEVGARMTPTSVFSRRRQAFLFSLYRSKSMNAVYFGNLLQTSFNFFLDFTEVGARMPPTSVFSYRRHSISSRTLPKWEQDCRLLRYSLADGRQFLLGLYRSGSKNDGYFGILLLTAGFFFLSFTEVRA